jgi:uncharacterized protein YbjT (DUF2867 family)
MKLTVVGATGGVGRSVVSQALDADEDVAGTSATPPSSKSPILASG